MDSAYDDSAVADYSKQPGHIPVIEHNPRRGEKREMSPSEKKRYARRSSAGRVSSNLKDNHGGGRIRVKGSAKIMTRMMSGLIVITAVQLFRLLIWAGSYDHMYRFQMPPAGADGEVCPKQAEKRRVVMNFRKISEKETDNGCEIFRSQEKKN